MKIHELKTVYPHFNLVNSGAKKFELRKNDRDYNVGDILHLRYYDSSSKKYLDKDCLVSVTHILTHQSFEAVPDGWVIMSIEKIYPPTQK